MLHFGFLNVDYILYIEICNVSIGINIIEQYFVFSIQYANVLRRQARKSRVEY